MRITSKVIIDRPRQRVLELMMDPKYLSQWQPGVRSVELLNGERDQVGARSRVVFDALGIRLAMTETILQRQPPELFAAVYEARGIRNTVENRFYADGPEQTRWVMSNALEFTGLLSAAAGLVQDSVVKQTRESMARFKMFAEKS
jgi:uncharacterized membrane protein